MLVVGMLQSAQSQRALNCGGPLSPSRTTQPSDPSSATSSPHSLTMSRAGYTLRDLCSSELGTRQAWHALRAQIVLQAELTQRAPLVDVTGLRNQGLAGPSLCARRYRCNRGWRGGPCALAERGLTMPGRARKAVRCGNDLARYYPV